jgi:CheY-like chemotaxis protein
MTGNELDFTGHFEAYRSVPEPTPTDAELKKLDELGTIGESELKASGMYVRMVTAAPAGPQRKPADCVVLVVEDDAATAGLITTVLEKSGYASRRAANRKEIAGGLSAQPRPAVVLLDVKLSDADGFDVLNRIRQHATLREIPVVMVTSLAARKDLAKGLMLGADGYLTKPLSPSTLLKAVRAVTRT